MSVLLTNLRRFADILDEVQIWINTDGANPERESAAQNASGDLAWLRSLPDQWDKCVLYELPAGAERKYPKQLNTGKFYAYTLEPETLYFRFDDDIVYIDDGYFESMVSFRTEYHEHPLVYGNIINNAVTSYVHQQLGHFDKEHGVVESEYCMDMVGWQSGPFAKYVHETLLNHIEAGTTSELFFGRHDLPGTRFSISNFCFTGGRMRTMRPEIDDEEIWLAERIPRRDGICNTINGGALVAHYCVDEDTEILTRKGWKGHDDLEPGELVAGVDLATGLARWTTCSAVHRYDYDGEMIAVEKPSLSMRLTPNHRCIVDQTTGRQRVPQRAVVEARDLMPRYSIPRSAAWAETGEAETIGIRIASICGWIAAEGWYDKGETVRLSQSLTANPANVAKIDALLPTAYRRVSVAEWRGSSREYVVWRLDPDDARQVRSLMPEKLLTADLANLSYPERQALLEAFIDGDGHVTKQATGEHVTISQKNKVNLDWLQMIAVTLGYKTTLRRFRDYNKWALTITTGRSVTLRGANGVHGPIPREWYRGVIWCPSTGTGTFIARRNGAVFVTGNSFFAQRAYLDKTDILARYRRIAEEKLSARYYELLGSAGET